MKNRQIPENFYQESLFLFENRRLMTKLDVTNKEEKKGGAYSFLTEGGAIGSSSI